ncbi:MAG: PIG-L family deacetylase [Prolixibacteraceae bacterium]|nr:PIG-L family deacetylase [Prolixibacteraceae bacterium]MBN2774413.1 PIG-L family deacetylase [Prolixibacteraceae bacterium]
MKKISRRSILKTTGLAAGATTLGLSAFSKDREIIQNTEKKLKIVIIGAHPDDPETNCGGLISLFTNKGHEAVVAYLTRGEAGIPGKSHEEASEIRTKEAIEACKIMKAKPVFLGQIDGSCEIIKDSYSLTRNLFEEEKPDIVITHWPIDTHRDHRICSLLVYDAWLRMDKKFELYYSESMTGEQSQGFYPDTYVDITSVIEQKHEACFCHVSQEVKSFYKTSHERMEIFRGMECNCKYAEAFVKHPQNPNFVELNSIIKAVQS